MKSVTEILSELESGQPHASEQLLPLVYTELRKLAAAKLSHERPGQTLQATSLVHEAYLRLLGGSSNPCWNSKGHFFAAAAEAMRRILVENARRKGRLKRGGGLARVDLADVEIASPQPDVDLLALDASLTRLADLQPEAARLVELRFFTGLTLEQAASLMEISPATAARRWKYARAWLAVELQEFQPID